MDYGMTLDATPAAEATPATRSDIWFDDGNIVLEAGRKQFKVHRGMLALHSSVFKDMLSVPQPPMSGKYCVDGCAVVHLTDSAEDLEIVLRALIRREFAASREPVSIAIVIAFLRLGRKYDFEGLRVEALHRIFYEVPSTLEDFDKIEKGSRILDSDQPVFWLDMLHLAREQDLQSVLPLALYECCHLIRANDPSMVNPLAQAVRRNDGTSAFLSIHDQITCLSCYPRLLILQHNTTYAWMDNWADAYRTMGLPCTDSSSCAARRNNVLRELFVTNNQLGGLYPGDIFAALYTHADGGTIKCNPCSEILIRMHAIGRRDFWDRLPLTFGLPGWQELRDERAECVGRRFASGSASVLIESCTS